MHALWYNRPVVVYLRTVLNNNPHLLLFIVPINKARSTHQLAFTSILPRPMRTPNKCRVALFVLLALSNMWTPTIAQVCGSDVCQIVCCLMLTPISTPQPEHCTTKNGFDWVQAIGNVIAGGIGVIPEAGGILQGIFNVIWPAATGAAGDPTRDFTDCMWNQITSYVQQYVSAAIDAQEVADLQKQLSSTKDLLQQYVSVRSRGVLCFAKHFVCPSTHIPSAPNTHTECGHLGLQPIQERVY